MEIRPYEPSMAADVAAAYNAIIPGVPHCYPVSTERFADAVSAAGAGGSSNELLHSERAFVALEGGSVQGFAHTAIGRQDQKDPSEYGFIRFCWYPPGRRALGQMLLETAEGHLHEQGIVDIVAFPQWHRYPFYYLPSAYLSDRLGQVVALLGHNGYHRVHGEVYMDWPNYRPPEPCPAAVSVDLSLTWLEGRGALPGLLVRAYQGSKHVATCECASCADYAEGDVAQDWAFTKWVGVATELRGQGLGRYLLQQALCEMHRAGYRHASISTAWQNYPAALFYTNLGYQVVDWTYAYGRALEPHRVPFS